MKVFVLLVLINWCNCTMGQSKIVQIDTTANCYFVDHTSPLPFSPDLSLRFSIPGPAKTIIEVHEVVSDEPREMKSRSVATLIDSTLSQGTYNVYWDGKDSNDKICDKNGKYIYYLLIMQEQKTLFGQGFVKFESKVKVTGTPRR